ncbi:MAG: histidine kinase [Eubacteriales bacterium]|nr:histidine kinase [Eubacteriales bacterium]
MSPRTLSKLYSDMKLQSKFTIALVLIVFIPGIFIAILFLPRLYNMVISDTIRKEQDAASTTVPAIEQFIYDIVNTSASLTQEPFYEQLFFQPVNTPLTELLVSEDSKDFEKSIAHFVDSSELTAIHFYLDLPRESLQTDSGQNVSPLFSSIQDARTYWRGILHGNSGLKELHCPPSYLGEQERKSYGDHSYVRRTTLYYQGHAVDAYIVCYYSGSSLYSILQRNLLLEKSVSYILNRRNDVIISSDDTLTGTYLLDYKTVEESFMSSNNFVVRQILNNEVYAGFYSINEANWFMVTVLPSRPMIHQGNIIILQIFLIYIAILILAIFLANALSRSITNRISSVIRQMRKVREGPPIAMPRSTIHDEVGDLIDTYNYMTDKMTRLIESQAKAAEDLRIAEFKSLQAQINPHFLYNTMDMINWMAQQGRTEEISDVVQNLSRFYKLTLSKTNGISDIGNEVEHVTIYVRLQNMRYSDNIQLITDIPDELQIYQIPKLTLQPVIENAILHGILAKDSKSGTIVLTGWLEGNDVVLFISDNGVGIPKEKLDVILTGSGNSFRGGNNIAVYNTHRRLQVLYGSNYGLHYSSQLGQGTEVEIRIPALRSPTQEL